MIRKLRWPLLALALVVVGVWPAAATPIALAAAGAATVIGLIPGPALLAAGVIAWLRHRPAPARTA
ncbi:hypothetical protein [Streptomyces sp. NPDC101166]|uniref:hypothetical protein n=1 Tax=Streptomyces sp. NPDC101166 TaxID=3366120 RepID=UPI0038014532